MCSFVAPKYLIYVLLLLKWLLVVENICALWHRWKIRSSFVQTLESKNIKHWTQRYGWNYGVSRCRIFATRLTTGSNIYEDCFWSAITPLSGASIAQDVAPQQFSDFTAGR